MRWTAHATLTTLLTFWKEGGRR